VFQLDAGLKVSALTVDAWVGFYEILSKGFLLYANLFHFEFLKIIRKGASLY